MNYTKERDLSNRTWEFYRDDEEGAAAAYGVSFAVTTKDGLEYPIISLQKLILPDSLIKYIVEEFGKLTNKPVL